MLLYQVQLGEMPESDSVIVEQLHLTTWLIANRDLKQSHETISKNMLLYQVQLGEMPESDSVIVEQLHLTTWPDHGVPSSTSNLLGI
jgi:phenylpyruvate tautomerase PptA (4-oxalocrotonate tautomerase family)